MFIVVHEVTDERTQVTIIDVMNPGVVLRQQIKLSDSIIMHPWAKIIAHKCLFIIFEHRKLLDYKLSESE